MPSHYVIVQLDGVQPLRLRASHASVPGQIHTDPQVQRAQPDGIDARYLGQDAVEIVDAFEGLDLDHDGGGVIEVSVDAERVCGVVAYVRDTREEPEGRSGAGASGVGAEFRGGEYVLCLGDGVDLGDNNGGASVEGVPDSGVVVAGDAK